MQLYEDGFTAGDMSKAGAGFYVFLLFCMFFGVGGAVTLFALSF